MKLPSEFRYWDHLDRPDVRRLRRVLGLWLGADPTLPDDVVRTWASTYFDADPIAEAFVGDASLAGRPGESRRLVDIALASGIDAVRDAPASLRRIFAEIETPPPWVDRAAVALGARVFRRWGRHLHSFAGAITLEGYRENSVAKPLAMTGAYVGASANNRFLETASFWIDVSEPGALEPGGRGRATALRVRLMHVLVRARLLADPRWQLEAWGVPISQADALLTLMGGSVLPAYGLSLLGYRTSREEIEATLHFWRYVGHLMGVCPRWYPPSVDDAVRLMFTSSVKGVGGSGDDGKSLARSYLEAYAPRTGDSLRERVARSIDHGLERGYVSWFVPPSTRRLFELPGPGVFRLAPLAQAPFIFARETLRRRSALVDDWVDARARRQAKAWVAARLGEHRAEYRAAERLRG